MTKDTKNQHILISDKETGLPYSKGLMASQVMVTGLSPWRSYQVAEAIEERLREWGTPSVTTEELDRLAVSVIEDLAGERYAKNYSRWREVDLEERRDRRPERVGVADGPAPELVVGIEAASALSLQPGEIGADAAPRSYVRRRRPQDLGGGRHRQGVVRGRLSRPGRDGRPRSTPR